MFKKLKEQVGGNETPPNRKGLTKKQSNRRSASRESLSSVSSDFAAGSFPSTSTPTAVDLSQSTNKSVDESFTNIVDGVPITSIPIAGSSETTILPVPNSTFNDTPRTSSGSTYQQHHASTESIVSLFRSAISSASNQLAVVMPSDTEESEMEDQLDHYEKDDLIVSFHRVERKLLTYKQRFKDLVTAYKEVENERVSIYNKLEKCEDKASKRISELKEEVSLNHKAKAHLEENLKVEIEERDEKIKVLLAKLDAVSSEVASTSPDESELVKYKDKCFKLEGFIIKAKDAIKLQKSRFAELQNVASQKAEEYDCLKEEFENYKLESTMQIAECKQQFHSEMESRELEIDVLKVTNKKQEDLYANLQVECQGLQQRLDSDNSELIDDLSRGKNAALQLLQDQKQLEIEQLKATHVSELQAEVLKHDNYIASILIEHKQEIGRLSHDYELKLHSTNEQRKNDIIVEVKGCSNGAADVFVQTDYGGSSEMLNLEKLLISNESQTISMEDTKSLQGKEIEVDKSAVMVKNMEVSAVTLEHWGCNNKEHEFYDSKIKSHESDNESLIKNIQDLKLEISKLEILHRAPVTEGDSNLKKMIAATVRPIDGTMFQSGDSNLNTEIDNLPIKQQPLERELPSQDCKLVEIMDCNSALTARVTELQSELAKKSEDYSQHLSELILSNSTNSAVADDLRAHYENEQVKVKDLTSKLDTEKYKMKYEAYQVQVQLLRFLLTARTGFEDVKDNLIKCSGFESDCISKEDTMEADKISSDLMNRLTFWTSCSKDDACDLYNDMITDLQLYCDIERVHISNVQDFVSTCVEKVNDLNKMLDKHSDDLNSLKELNNKLTEESDFLSRKEISSFNLILYVETFCNVTNALLETLSCFKTVVQASLQCMSVKVNSHTCPHIKSSCNSDDEHPGICSCSNIEHEMEAKILRVVNSYINCQKVLQGILCNLKHDAARLCETLNNIDFENSSKVMNENDQAFDLNYLNQQFSCIKDKLAWLQSNDFQVFSDGDCGKEILSCFGDMYDINSESCGSGYDVEHEVQLVQEFVVGLRSHMAKLKDSNEESMCNLIIKHDNEMSISKIDKQSILDDNINLINTNNLKSNEIAALQERVTKLNPMICEVNDAKVEILKCISDAVAFQTTLSQEMDRLCKELNDVKHQRSDLGEENNLLTNEIKSLKEHIVALELDIQQKDDLANKLREELTGEISQLTISVDSLSNERLGLINERSGLHSMVQSVTAEKEVLEKSNNLLLEEMESVKVESKNRDVNKDDEVKNFRIKCKDKFDQMKQKHRNDFDNIKAKHKRDIEIIQEANESEVQKLMLENRNIEKVNSEKLNELNKSHEIYCKQLVGEHSEAIAKIVMEEKQMQESLLDSHRSALTDQSAELKNLHNIEHELTKELKLLTDSYRTKVDDLENAKSKEITEIKFELSKETSQREQIESEFKFFKTTSDREKESLMSQRELDCEALKDYYQEEITELQASLQSWKERNDNTIYEAELHEKIEELKLQHSADLDKAKSNSRFEIDRLKQCCEEEVDLLKYSHVRELESVAQQQKSEIERVRMLHEADFEGLRSQHRKELDESIELQAETEAELKKKHNENDELLNDEIVRLNANIDKLDNDLTHSKEDFIKMERDFNEAQHILHLDNQQLEVQLQQQADRFKLQANTLAMEASEQGDHILEDHLMKISEMQSEFDIRYQEMQNKYQVDVSENNNRIHHLEELLCERNSTFGLLVSSLCDITNSLGIENLPDDFKAGVVGQVSVTEDILENPTHQDLAINNIVSTVKSRLESLFQTCDNSKRDKENLSALVERNDAEIIELQRQLVTAQSAAGELSERAKQLANLTSALSERDIKLRKFQNQISGFEGKITGMEKQLEVKEDKVKELMLQVKKNETLAMQKDNRLTELEGEIDVLRKEHSIIVEQLKDLKLESEVTEKNMLRLENMNKKHINIEKKMKVKVDGLLEECNSREHKIHDFDLKVNDLVQQKKVVDEQKDELVRKCSQLELEYNAILESKNQLDNNFKLFKDESFANLKKKESAYSEKLSELMSSRGTLEEKAELLNTEFKEKVNDLNKLHNSEKMSLIESETKLKEEVEILIQGHKEEIEKITMDHSETVKQLHKKQNAELSVLTAEKSNLVESETLLKKELEDLIQNHRTQLQNNSASEAEAVKRLHEIHSAELSALRSEKMGLIENETKLKAHIETMGLSHKADIEELCAVESETVKQLRGEIVILQQRYQEIEKNSAEKLSELQREQQEAINILRKKMKSKLDNLNKENSTKVSELSDNIEKITSENQLLTADVVKARAQSAKAESELEVTKSILTESKESEINYVDTIKTLKTEIQSLSEKLHVCKNEKDGLAQREEVMNSQLHDLQKNLNDVERNLSVVRTQLRTMEERHEQEKREQESITSSSLHKLTTKTTELERLKTHVSKIEATFTADIAKRERTIKELQIELEKQGGNENASKLDEKGVKAKIDGLKAHYRAKIENQEHQHNENIRLMREQFASQQTDTVQETTVKENKHLLEETQKLQDTLTLKNSDLERLKGDNLQFSNEISRLNNEIVILSSNLQTINTEENRIGVDSFTETSRVDLKDNSTNTTIESESEFTDFQKAEVVPPTLSRNPFNVSYSETSLSNSSLNFSYQNLEPIFPDPSQMEYLRRVLYNYMMGREPRTMARVLVAMVRFTETQAEEVLDRTENTPKWGASPLWKS